MKRAAIQGIKVESMIGEPEYKRAFDVLVDVNSGSILLDVKEKKGFVRLSLESLMEQIDQIVSAICENNL